MLRLIQRGGEFSIMLGANELMNSRLSGSEEAMASLAIDALGERQAPHWLIGGLGMGFTLRAALSLLSPEAKVTVVELVPAIIAWARGPLAEVFGESLTDPRVAIVEADICDAVGSARSTYDAILLDVDNGPDGLTRDSNDWLYGRVGLERARLALKPAGVIAVWSASSDAAFGRRMTDAGFATETHRVRAGRGKGAHHTIWIGQRG
jgi:spermidine synthase